MISWASTRQKSVTTSSTESKYVSGCQAIKELIWIKGLLTELLGHEKVKASFNMDNQSKIRLVENPVFHKITKHIVVKYNFMREKL